MNKKKSIVFSKPKEALFKYYNLERSIRLVTPKVYEVEVIEECEQQYKIRLLNSISGYKKGDTIWVNKSDIIFPKNNNLES